MRLSRILLTAGLMLAVLAGCSDSGNDENPPAPDNGVEQDSSARDGGVGQDTGPLPDGAPPPADSAASACPCGAGQVCTTDNTCIDEVQPVAGEIYGELILLRQINNNITGVLSNVGKAEVLLRDWTPLPQDTRTHWNTVDPGGDCAYEVDTNYPYSYDSKEWPAGHGLGAGKITFTPQGAPAPGLIELDPLDMEPGHYYFHDDVPPALKEGYGTHRDFFEVEHIPFGAAFEVQLAGGPDIGAVSISGGETAREFAIISPAVEQAGATAPGAAPLKITWSPAQLDATMEIFITQNWGLGGTSLLTCTVPDDGETTIPAAALGNFMGEVGVQLRRSVSRYSKTQIPGGKTMHVHVIGRHARIGRLTLSD